MLMHRGSVSSRSVVLENAFMRAGCISFEDDGLEGGQFAMFTA